MINLFNLSLGNYIYEEIDGVSISRDKLDFSVFLKNFYGVLLYCRDSNNVLLIELTQDSNVKSITIKYNRIFDKFNVTDLNLGSCFQYSNVFLVISLQMRNREIKILCKEKTASLKLSRKSDDDQFKLYPKPNYDFSVKNKLFLWMGNIGYYIGSNSVHYLPLKNQLFGCIDAFLINDRKLNLKENRTIFLSSCDLSNTESWCIERNCTEKKVTYKMYDCSARILNFKHCSIKLFKYSLLPRSFNNIQTKEGIIYFRIDWEKSTNIKHSLCLLEIKMKNDRYLTFHIDRYNYIIMEIIDFNIEQTTKNISLLVSSTETNTLLIHFHKDYVTIQIYNGEKINGYTFYLNTKFEIINVGFFQHRNLYYDFDGNMNIYYDSGSWEPVSDSHVSTTTAPDSKLKKIFTMIIIIVLFILVSLIVLLTFAAIKLKKKSKSNIQQIVTYNRSKTPSPNAYECEETVIPLNNKNIVNGDITDEDNVSNYEILQ